MNRLHELLPVAGFVNSFSTLPVKDGPFLVFGVYVTDIHVQLTAARLFIVVTNC